MSESNEGLHLLFAASTHHSNRVPQVSILRPGIPRTQSASLVSALGRSDSSGDLHLLLSRNGGSRSLQAPESTPQINAGFSPGVLYQGTAGRSGIHRRLPQSTHPFPRNKVRGEAALKPTPQPTTKEWVPHVPILGRGIARTQTDRSCIRARLQSRRTPPAHFSRNKVRGEAALKSAPQRAHEIAGPMPTFRYRSMALGTSRLSPGIRNCHPERPKRSEGSRRICGCSSPPSSTTKMGCPILASLGWDSTDPHPPSFASRHGR